MGRSRLACALLAGTVCLVLAPRLLPGGGAAPSSPVQQPSLDALVERELPSLVELYKTLHAQPELSFQEKNTSALLARELRALGYEVTEHVGQYEHSGRTSYGVVAVMRNSPGPTVLIRTDMDALPVEEKTGLPYASKMRTKDDAGLDVGVMHACGHDLHMASFLGTARLLAQLKDRWRGTVVLVAQPSEEVLAGARAMLRDRLYARFPKPDYALALHDWSDLPAGQVGYSPGYMLASATSVGLTIRGVGGHGSQPENTKDPIVVAAQVVLALQTIVSRENSPFDPAVVTVGSIRGGTKHNIIPDEVHLQLTIRTYREEVRQRILASIERIAKNTALAAGIPEDRLPVMRVEEATPATYNDPELTARLRRAFENAFGPENVTQMPPIMASEDFGYFGLDNREVPICMFWLGAADPEKVKHSQSSGVPLPGLHSSLFAPLPEPAIRTGVKAMTAAALHLLGK